jgi:hypothetical protein
MKRTQGYSVASCIEWQETARRDEEPCSRSRGAAVTIAARTRAGHAATVIAAMKDRVGVAHVIYILANIGLSTTEFFGCRKVSSSRRGASCCPQPQTVPPRMILLRASMQREHFVLIGKAYHKRRALLLDLLPINFSNDPAAVTVFQARHRIIALTDMHLHPLYNCRQQRSGWRHPSRRVRVRCRVSLL